LNDSKGRRLGTYLIQVLYCVDGTSSAFTLPSPHRTIN
jgi:hypothetical protein